MKYPHIATGLHMGGKDPRFRINTTPGVMEPKHGINEAHGSFLQRHTAIELRDELNAWLDANPTIEERIANVYHDKLDESDIATIVDLVRRHS